MTLRDGLREAIAEDPVLVVMVAICLIPFAPFYYAMRGIGRLAARYL